MRPNERVNEWTDDQTCGVGREESWDVPGVQVPLRTYIKALIASWMVWPRCITVAIPGTGYTLPSEVGPHSLSIHVHTLVFRSARRLELNTTQKAELNTTELRSRKKVIALSFQH